MKKLDTKDIKGYITALTKFEQNSIQFYKDAMNEREESSPEYKGFEGGYYGHLHCLNILNDILKLFEDLGD